MRGQCVPDLGCSYGKGFGCCFFLKFVELEESDRNDGRGDDLRQFQRSTRAVGCCHSSCTRRLLFNPKCTKIVDDGRSAPDSAGAELTALPQTPYMRWTRIKNIF